MTSSIVLWSRFPPPEGGVTVSAVRIVNALADQGRLGGVVDLGDPRSWANGLGRTHRHLFWCSTPAAARHHGRLARLARGPRFLLVHGGDPAGAGRPRRTGPPFETVFATNDVLAAHLEGTGLGRRVAVATAWVPLPDADGPDGAPRPPAAPPAADRPLRILVGVGPEQRWYGLETAVEAVGLLRERYGLDARLTVVGPVPDAVVADHPDHVRADGPVPAATMPDVLAAHDLVLRPTTADGDSLLVRDALQAGLRVVASDVVPRPAGVELAAPDADALAEAVQAGGRVSDGRGTGPPVLDLL